MTNDARCPKCGSVLPKGADQGSLCPKCLLRLAVDATDAAVLCKKCHQPMSPTEAKCPSCGAKPDSATSRPTRSPLTDHSPPDSGPHVQDDRFYPGYVLEKRYRIVGLLGRGGMGEVWQADDLKLGQPVALKFLSAELSNDRASLQILLDEVRMARQVGHPNVCRVFDIGETDGVQYLSMQYVDGEDLASLLRRIGRLPREKAMQIAQQLCAGLGAAHNEGILHRDLKPGNVMLDSRGRVQITDFGLAAIVKDLDGIDVQMGTPAYMAPEQLTGTGVSVQSDIYSLGVVLYELFTGRHPFESNDSAQPTDGEIQRTPTKPSSHVSGLDPHVEKVILGCLRSDPRKRPPSAIAVAAAFPGGDPLVAALAAGETPSPELVAAAKATPELTTTALWMSVGALIVGLALIFAFSNRLQVSQIAALEYPPAVLAAKAHEVVVALGYGDEISVDDMHAFDFNRQYLRTLADYSSMDPTLPPVESGRAGPLKFWCRQSPGFLSPVHRSRTRMSYFDPPFDTPGMLGVHIDSLGRLRHFERVGRPADLEDSGVSVDWGSVFELAGLSLDRFERVEPSVFPRLFSEDLYAWKGSYPEPPYPSIRVEAATLGDRASYFSLVEPWAPESIAGDRRSMPRPAEYLLIIWFGVVFLGAIIVARRNLRLGRGDRDGALRFAVYLLAARLLVWALLSHHVPDPSEVNIFIAHLAVAMYRFGIGWVCYLAMEPYFRRLWPRQLVTWVRFGNGQWRDPVVGRDIMVGVLFGVFATAIPFVLAAILEWTGNPPLLGRLPIDELRSLRSLRLTIGSILYYQTEAVVASLYSFLGLLALRLILRRTWLAAAAYAVLMIGLLVAVIGSVSIGLVVGVFAAGLWIHAMFRFGLLTVSTGFSVIAILLAVPLSTDLFTWYSGGTIIGVGIVLTLFACGLTSALANRSVLQTSIPEI